MKDRIARWHRQGLWTASMVDVAVTKGVITAGEAAEIIGEEQVRGN